MQYIICSTHIIYMQYIICSTAYIICSTHPLLVVWIIVAHFHLCSLLDRYSILEVWAVDSRCVFAVAADGDGACFSLTFGTVWRSVAWCIIRPCIQCMAGACSYTGRCSRCMVYMDPEDRLLSVTQRALWDWCPWLEKFCGDVAPLWCLVVYSKVYFDVGVIHKQILCRFV